MRRVQALRAADRGTAAETSLVPVGLFSVICIIDRQGIREGISDHACVAAGSVPEPKAEWTAAAQRHLDKHLRAIKQARGLNAATYAPDRVRIAQGPAAVTPSRPDVATGKPLDGGNPNLLSEDAA